MTRERYFLAGDQYSENAQISQAAVQVPRKKWQSDYKILPELEVAL